MHMHIYVFFPKYSQLNLYNVSCVNAFSADHLEPVAVFFPEEGSLCHSKLFHLPTVLGLGLKPYGFFSIQSEMLIGVN